MRTKKAKKRLSSFIPSGFLLKTLGSQDIIGFYMPRFASEAETARRRADEEMYLCWDSCYLDFYMPRFRSEAETARRNTDEEIYLCWDSLAV